MTDEQKAELVKRLQAGKLKKKQQADNSLQTIDIRSTSLFRYSVNFAHVRRSISHSYGFSLFNNFKF